MQKSLYQEYVDKYFTPILLALFAQINDKANPMPYLFLSYLTKTYSTDGKWESMLAKHKRVIADVVSEDSPLPLKKRDVITKANGVIPKIGIEMQLKESELTKIDTLKKLGKATEAISMIFDDTNRAFYGVYERLEAMFYQALSTGIILVDTENVGLGIRLDFGFLTENKFGVASTWDNVSSATPIDDIQKLLDKVRNDGNSVQTMWMNRSTFEKLKRTAQFRQQWAFTQNFVGGSIPTPNDEQALSTILAYFRLQVNIVDRPFISEIDGVRTQFDAWQDGMITFTRSGVVGDLVYADLAELNHKVEGISYQLMDGYILMAKFHEKRPALKEVTQAQARAIPVIVDTLNIYQLDTTEVQEQPQL